MTKKTLLMILLALSLPAVPTGLLAQDSDKVVILSPRLGSVIDAAERERYELFPEVRGFDRGVFLQTPEKTYYAKIMFVGPDGKAKDTTVQYRESYLLMLAEKIDHFEDLASGNYRMGQKPATLIVPGAEKPRLPQMKWQSVAAESDLLAFATESNIAQLESFPKVGFGIGLSSYSPDISQLSSIVTAIEQKYRNQGYSIQRRRVTFATSGFLSYSLKIRVSRLVALLFEAGSSVGDEGESGKVTFKAVSGYILFHAQPSSLPWFRPYVGVGLAQYRVSLGNTTVSYGTENRISPVSSYGSYTYLSSVDFTGSKNQSGFTFMAGIELAPGSIPAVSLFGSYAGIPDAEAVATGGERATMRLSSFQFGARAMIYF